ncbi:MAG TPA: filamentous hemagglutinin N-terminal domain-containing protein, partial [Phycisphaerae bacterium]|nr:filamentous hemagglutinin N-terminal domain-containing protein [Phycisphaerae bacterium]
MAAFSANLDHAHANGPIVVDHVAAGEASFDQVGDLMTITAANHSIIDYQQFNIPKGNTVDFVQPSASATVLNKIIGPTPTLIDGNLNANGIVYFVNPAGVTFGGDAVVNVGQIYAAAAHMSDADFLSGTNNFTNATGAVINAGTIHAGAVSFVGQNIVNSGTIATPEGMVVMAAGNNVYVSKLGSPIVVQVAGGKSETTGVNNSGTINAQGGDVTIRAGDLYSLAINTSGTVQASNINIAANGDASTVLVSGKLNAANQGPGNTGGTVSINGGNIGVGVNKNASGAFVDAPVTIDASGTMGGGSILIGVTADPASSTGYTDASEFDYIGASAVLNASATVKGNGGLIDSSGELLYVSPGATVTADGAGGGAAGVWLLDPFNVTITSGAASYSGFSGGGGSGTYNANVSGATITDGQINTDLTGGTSIMITTGNSGGESGNITMLTGVDIDPSLSSTVTLTLDAAGEIIIESGVTIAPTGTGGLNVSLMAGSNITVNDDITTNGGNCMIDSTGGDIMFASNGGGGYYGITTNGPTGGYAAGNVGLTALGNITVGNISAIGGASNAGNGGGGGNITLTSSGAAGTINTGAINTSGGYGYEGGGSAGYIKITASGTVSTGDFTASGGGSYYGNAGSANYIQITTAGDISTGDISAVGGSAGYLGSGAYGGGGDNVTLNSTGVAGTVTVTGAINTSGGYGYEGGGSAGYIKSTAGGTVSTGDLTASGGGSYYGNAGSASFIQITTAGDISTGDISAVGGSGGAYGGGAYSGGGGNVTLSSTGATGTINTGTINTSGGYGYEGGGSAGYIKIAAGGAVSTGDLTASGGDAYYGTAGSANYIHITTAGDISTGNISAVGGSAGYLGSGAYGGGGGNVKLNSTGAAGTVTVSGAINTNGGYGYEGNGNAGFVNVSAAGNVQIGAISAIGASSAAGYVDLSTTVGQIRLNGDVNTSGGGQTYTGPVLIGGTISLLDTDGADIIFTSTIDDGNAAGTDGLTVDTTGLTDFKGSVGNSAALQYLDVDNTGVYLGSDIDINGAGVTTDVGGQIYGGAVLITATTTLADTDGGAITFDSTINDGNAAGTDGLTVDTTGLTSFDGDVGNTVALQYLDVDGGSDINGASITTDSGGQTYGGAVLITATTTLTDTDAGNITFDSTINDGNTAGTDGLTVNTTGLTSFDGDVGGTTALQYLDVDGDSDINGAGITTDEGGQIYGGAVLITATTTLADTDAGNITFDSTINDGNAAGTDGLTVDTTGLTSFDGAVGGTTALQDLDVDNSSDINGAGVTTDSGGQTYGGAVLITAPTTLADTDAGNITFDSTINDGNAAGTDGLTVDTTGLTDFKGSVGNTAALEYLDVDTGTGYSGGTTDINGAGVTTDAGGQTYGGAVLITATTTLTDTNGGDITFDSTINDGNAAGTDGLTVDTTGVTSFDGDVGNTTALQYLEVDSSSDINGAGVTTDSGGQTYGSAVLITATTTLTDTDGGDITFDSTINDGNAAGTDGLTVDTTGLTDFKGSVGGTTALEYLDVDNSSDINGAGITTDSGGQTYGGAVLITATTTLTDTDGGNITFDATINDGNAAGTDGLTVDTTGLTDFKGSVGNSAALQYLDVDNTGVYLGSDIDINGASVTTDVGGQTYGGAVLITTTTTLKDTDAGNITFDSTINDGNAAGTDGLTVDTTGLTDFKGSVGNSAALQYLDVDTGMGYSGGTTDINGAGATTDSGGQTYGGAVLITATTTLTDTDGGDITFDSTINDGNAAGTDGLTVDTTGLTDFKGSVGNTAALKYLDVGNSSDINGAGITTDSGGQTYGGAVLITTTTTLKDTDAGDITFDSTINDGNAAGTDGLTVDTTGLTDFKGSVGNTAALQYLDVDGGSDINGAGITTDAGGQTYGGAVLITATTTLKDTDAGNITFDSMINDGNAAGTDGLTVDTTGLTSFDGDVGGTTALKYLDVDNSSDINGAGITTDSGGQTYGGAVLITATTTLTDADGGDITFDSTINDGNAAGTDGLTVDTTGLTDFKGSVGNTTALQYLDVDTGMGYSGGTTDINGASVTTDSGGQTYGGAVLITTTTTLKDIDAGNITFDSTINDGNAAGTDSLTVDTTGETDFKGDVGNT